MKILGIETSCDETAAAVVQDGVHVLSNVIASSANLHALTGGVVPEVAAREHLRQISPVIDQALHKVSVTWDDIDAIAVTHGPGLIASLLVGVNTAATLAYLHDKPLIPTHHIAGHIYANFLDGQAPIEFPFLVLTVSGGHNELVLLRSHFEFEVIGETLDDAAGEAFDKVARLLGLGYPGGPAIAQCATAGDLKAFKLPRAKLKGKHRFDFSFSGLKSAVRREIDNLPEGAPPLAGRLQADLAASFQEAVVEVLADKLVAAAEELQVPIVHLAGGVSANQRLRQVVREKLPPAIKLYMPKNLAYCTDNAAMIAGAAYFLQQKHPPSPDAWRTVKAEASLNLSV